MSLIPVQCLGSIPYSTITENAMLQAMSVDLCVIAMIQCLSNATRGTQVHQVHCLYTVFGISA